jgi:hypothetical protein
VQYLIVLAILSAVVVFVTVPLRRAAPDRGGAEGTELDELEAAREAKYRELRDAELDHRTGKLSDADYEALDRSLRGEAIEILRRIDREQEPGATIGEP